MSGYAAMMIYSTLFIALLTAVGEPSVQGSPASADAKSPAAAPQKTDKTTVEPTEIEADSMSFDQKTGKALLSGNVVVIDGDMKVWADRVDVVMDENQKLKHLLAIGNVRIKRGQDVAVCGRAEFDAPTSQLMLTDQPIVKRGASMILEAPIFVYNQQAQIFEPHQSREHTVSFARLGFDFSAL